MTSARTNAAIIAFALLSLVVIVSYSKSKDTGTDVCEAVERCAAAFPGAPAERRLPRKAALGAKPFSAPLANAIDLGSEAVPSLMEIAKRSESNDLRREFCIQALIGIGTPEAMNFIAEIVRSGTAQDRADVSNFLRRAIPELQVEPSYELIAAVVRACDVGEGPAVEMIVCLKEVTDFDCSVTISSPTSGEVVEQAKSQLHAWWTVAEGNLRWNPSVNKFEKTNGAHPKSKQ